MNSETPTTIRGYPVRLRRVVVADRAFELLGPANYESLIDDPRVAERFARDEYMPYWAEYWPACQLLADAVAQWPTGSAYGTPPTVLELGCGLGLASLAALARGYRVIASDYDDDALEFVRQSAARNGLPLPETRFIDWRETYAGLRLDRIVAAEVLYETRNLRPVAEFIERHLSADGFALIVDGNRSTADAFDAIARHCGLAVACTPVEHVSELGSRVVRGRTFRITHKREPASA